jgi:hypothetical protein
MVETPTSLVPMTGETKYRGVSVEIAGQEWVVPPLSVRQFRDNVKMLIEPVGEVTAENIVDRMDKFVPVIGMAMRRNYPDITDDFLFDALDLSTFATVLIAVQTASGMKVGKPGEAPPVAAK